MQHHDTFRVDYNVELFAGMYFHPKKVNHPTILFFRTGSYTMMGGKQWKILKECETFVKTLIEMFDKKIML
jgi:TATA-box binding protein (TBP) (component of TFIID and TFIIIB)